MNILFVHQNFPGQYQHLAPALVDQGHQVMAICQGNPSRAVPGVDIHGYRLPRGNTPDVHPFAIEFESKVLRGEACGRLAEKLRESGFIPDVTLAHPGWGEALYLKDVFPDTRLICFAEYYYRASGQDIGFDPEFPAPTFADRARLRTKNANLAIAFDVMDWGVAPTGWQASTHPAWVREKLSVIHDGINTDVAAPDPTAEIRLPDRRICVRPGDEVLTFIARNLEPVRGYHIFMRALPDILTRRPRAKVFIVGGEDVSYGARPESGSYRQRYLDEVARRLDPSRVFFMGRVSYNILLRLLQITRCHVYLTYPFVLSWSMLEAMSAGALVVGSRTPPVEEVIIHEKNGLLVDFFDVSGLANTVCSVLADPDAYAGLRLKGRQTIVEHYDLQRISLPAQIRLLEESPT